MTRVEAPAARSAFAVAIVLVVTIAGYALAMHAVEVPAIERGGVLRSGGVGVTLDKVERATAIELPTGTKQAEGEFAIATFTATNLDDADRVLAPQAVTLVDGQGRGFSPSAVSAKVQDPATLMLPLGPGETRTFVLVYDVWSGVEPAFFEVGRTDVDDPEPGRAWPVAGRLLAR